MMRWESKDDVCPWRQKALTDKTALFILQHGAVISNVILGCAQEKGIYCLGECTFKNVWWDDACKVKV
ncbi:putative pectate lyase protein [Eutypa lata UCREL1]|uniref:Pectate lyase n=1 Tax=Eutypa lata (strain UCR-EL1) TaxID=1287681 RepID=M7TPD2_EUTLA|nr:putative pectate lyase protein [Eutypa lata UCREL1]